MDVARANKIVTIDANPEYPVLNLGQSVVLLAYELYSGAQEEAARSVAATTATATGVGSGQWGLLLNALHSVVGAGLLFCKRQVASNTLGGCRREALYRLLCLYA